MNRLRPGLSRGALTFLFVVALLGVTAAGLQQVVRAQAKPNQSPMFQVDPLWPKPLPNKWVIGSTIGLSVDSRDHVWVIHRPATIEDNEKAGTLKNGDCCFVAPQIIEFDPDGNVVSTFGGPGAGYRVARFRAWNFRRPQR